MSEKSFTMMAFARGTESKDAPEFKYYEGFVNAKVLAVNPTKEELEKIYGRTLQNEPVYVSSTTLPSGTTAARVKIDFIIETEATDEVPSLKLKATYFLTKTHRINKDSTKCQVIDEFGRTSWVTKDEFKNHAIPVSSKTGKPLNITYPYRQIWIGEEDLVNFLKVYLGIPNPMDYIEHEDGSKEWVYKADDKLADCKADFAEIEKYFDGNIKEIREILSYQPNNKVKVLVGIRTYENKQYQDVFTQLVLPCNSTKTERFESAVAEQKEAGRYKDTEFVVKPIAEKKVVATDFSGSSSNGDMPFDAPAEPNW